MIYVFFVCVLLHPQSPRRFVCPWRQMFMPLCMLRRMWPAVDNLEEWASSQSICLRHHIIRVLPNRVRRTTFILCPHRAVLPRALHVCIWLMRSLILVACRCVMTVAFHHFDDRAAPQRRVAIKLEGQSSFRMAFGTLDGPVPGRWRSDVHLSIAYVREGCRVGGSPRKKRSRRTQL